jgi:hypothetical protein
MGSKLKGKRQREQGPRPEVGGLRHRKKNWKTRVRWSQTRRKRGKAKSKQGGLR